MDLLITVTATLGLLLSAVCAFALLLGSRRSSDDKKKKKLYAPAVGTILHQIVNFSRIYDYHTELSRKHKTFRLWSPFCQYIYTTDPVVVEYFLKTNFQNYGKGLMNYENLKDMLGDGIFAADGDKWRHQRKLASYGFSTKALRDFSSAIFRKNATKLAHVILSYAESNEKFDVQHLLMKSTMDSIFRIGFGVELNCLDSSHGGNEFAKSFDAANELLVLRYINPLWKLMRYLNIGSEAKLRDKIKHVDEFVYRLISIRIEQASETGNEPNEDILSRFLDERKKDPESISLQYLRDIILNFVLAGKDSTAGTLAWFFYLICKNSSVQEKIHKEVMEVTKAAEPVLAFDAFAVTISEDLITKMQYLHAALTETLRLFPPGPLMARMITTMTRRDVLRNRYRESIQEIEYDPYHGVAWHIGRLDRLFWKLEMQEFPILDNYRIWALVRSLPENLRDAAHQIWGRYEGRISYTQLCTEIIHYAECEEDPEEDPVEEPIDGFSARSLHVGSEQDSVSWHYVSWHHQDSVPAERVLVQPRQIGRVWIAIALGLVLVGVAITYLAY